MSTLHPQDDDALVDESTQASAPAAVASVRQARLGRVALAGLPTSVRTPAFDIDALRPGILHLGCGAFHRAHQALLTQRAIEVEQSTTGGEPPPWGIVATSMHSHRTARALAEQDGLYTVFERGPEQTTAEVVGTIRRTLYGPQASEAFQSVFADPAIRIVTLTVTSAGYCVDPSTGRLDHGSAAVQDDLRRDEPTTPIGLIARGLAQRRDNGVAPPVVLSCDNLPANGRMLQQACVDYAAMTDDTLSGWIDDAVQFPATMVDRIVPTPSESDRQDALRTLGVKDMIAVTAEPFAQWVIEQFDGPRPRWDAAGAEYVDDVGPWEASKLRLLNGGHLAIAYLGLLAGAATVADALHRPGFAAFAMRFMLSEQRPTLPTSDHDIGAYARQLLERWINHGIAHRLDRVGRDGSDKLPTRLLASLQDNLAAGRPAPCTILAIAAWLLCATQGGADGKPLIRDERSPVLRRMRDASGGDPERFVDTVLGLSAIFDDLASQWPVVRLELAAAIGIVQRGGPPDAMAAMLLLR